MVIFHKTRSVMPISFFIISHKIFLQFFFLIFTLQDVHGEVQICQNVQLSVQGVDPENCSLVCSLKFHHAVTATATDEITLCIKNTTLPVLCVSHNDCRPYHVGAYCKQVPCLCRAKAGPPEAYIIDPFFRAHKINSCVVSSKYVNLDQPIVPFPWKTLLVVCAIVFVFAAFLICLRWISPLIRSMNVKRSSRNTRARQATPQEDRADLFSPSNQQSSSDSAPFTYYFTQNVPRIYRASPRRSQRGGQQRSSRARYTAGAQSAEGTLSSRTMSSNEDKPPPYETAIQLPPPAYEEVARYTIHEGRPSDSPDVCVRASDQTVQVHFTDGNAQATQSSAQLHS